MKKILFVLTIALFTNIISAGWNPLGYQGEGGSCVTKSRNPFSKRFWSSSQNTSNECATGLNCVNGICQKDDVLG